MLRRLIFFCLAMTFLTGVSQANDITSRVDKFYRGLADIIERDMYNPAKCVKDADNYYKANRATVEKIREMTEKSMKEAMAAMDKYKDTPEEKLAALERDAARIGRKVPQPSPGSARYASALQKFTMKYPMEGMQVAAKSLAFLPKMEGER